MTPLERLKQHSDQFQKAVHEPAPGVLVAVGYAASNVSAVRTDQGLVIIDTTESTAAAKAILAEFRRVTAEPVAAIIYTHGHRDHVGGAAVFAAQGSPRIVARASLKNELAPGGSASNPGEILRKRAARQFGIPLKGGSERINLGIGPADRPIEGLGEGFVAPTETFEGDLYRLEVGGRVFELRAAPGETADQMVVWMPGEKILFAADNFYHSFPNLYAIRGTAYRDFEVWANTLDQMLELGAELMLTGHGQPVCGADAIAERLRDYRDAIRYIVHSCVAGMNQGLTPDQLVDYVRLPPELAAKPWLQEFYGTVAWSVRAFYAGKIGWFDGNPTHLFALHEQQLAARLSALVGEQTLLETLDAAMQSGDYQWVLHLSDWLQGSEHIEKVSRIRMEALRCIADGQLNATARNYYLTCALELEQRLALQ
jgi:alkyl sulfatase BDS1-like metallo-beta-lactamase superfamily hydrolase